LTISPGDNFIPGGIRMNPPGFDSIVISVEPPSLFKYGAALKPSLCHSRLTVLKVYDQGLASTGVVSLARTLGRSSTPS